jgi:hypothetical protein
MKVIQSCRGSPKETFHSGIFARAWNHPFQISLYISSSIFKPTFILGSFGEGSPNHPARPGSSSPDLLCFLKQTHVQTFGACYSSRSHARSTSTQYYNVKPF